MSDSEVEEVQSGGLQSPRNNPVDDGDEQEGMEDVTFTIDKKDSDKWRPDKPTMGDVLRIGKDDYMPLTGGKPNRDWTGLDVTKSRISALQYRPVGSSSIKGYTSRTRGLRTKFNKDGELESFVTDVMDHMKQTGLDTITYLPDPEDNNNMTSVVEHHGRFTLEYTKSAAAKVITKWDNYDKENDADAVLFLLNSLNNTFKKGIQQIITETDTFTVIRITTMRKCN